MRPRDWPRAVIALLLAAGILLFVPAQARACSCIGIGDVGAAVDEAEGAFVGTLVDKRDVGNFESIYVFEVEQWVKGEAGGAGDLIEVRSASDGAGCGFEFFGDDQRTGALLRLEGGELHSSLCEQIDADVLLTVLEGPPLSTTGIGKLLIANGWSTTSLSVLDETGAVVTELDTGDAMAGTQGLEMCPGGEVMLQSTGTAINVWDLRNLSSTASLAVPGDDSFFVSDISCRDETGTSILVMLQGEFVSNLVDLETGEVLVEEVVGDSFKIGSGQLIVQRDNFQETVAIDFATGEETILHEIPGGKNWGVYPEVNPFDGRIALTETRYPDEGGEPDSTLFIMSPTGKIVDQYDLADETSAPTWLDETLILIQTYDWDSGDDATALLVDTSTGETTTIEGWTASYPILVGNVLYGTRGGDVMTAGIEEGTSEVLVTLPTQELGAIIPLSDAAPQKPPADPEETPQPTVPALSAPESGIGESPEWPLRPIAIGTLVAFAGLLVWLALRKPTGDGGERSDR